MKKTLFVVALAVVGVVANAQSFSEGFESGPAGWFNGTGSTITYGNAAGGDDMAFDAGTWHATNASTPIGLSGWFTNSSVSTFFAHGGSKMANANFNSVAGDNTINSFMMSPTRTFNNGDKISFWTRTSDDPFFPDRLKVKLSTSGASTSVASFTTTLLDINPTYNLTDYPSVWTQFTITLSGLGGPTSGRFAFNYFVEHGGPSGDNSDFIGIDDVVYTAVPEPATMAALGLGFAALLRRRRK